MDFEKLAAERYSLRKFSDQPVEEETLARILEAGRNAPTAHNNQPQRILVLRSKEALALADGCARSHFDSPVMLVVSYDPADAWIREEDGKNHGEIDAAIATTQMMLQAADLGLGTTYIGMFDPEKLRAAFPEELAGLVPIALLPWVTCRERKTFPSPYRSQAAGGNGPLSLKAETPAGKSSLPPPLGGWQALFCPFLPKKKAKIYQIHKTGGEMHFYRLFFCAIFT